MPLPVAFKHFGMDRVMVCDRSDFRLKLAEKLGFAVCNPSAEDLGAKAAAYFGTAPSLSGSAANIDCWLDAAGAERILEDFLRLGKIESRFVSVAVNNKPRNIDLLHMTYAQQSIIGLRRLSAGGCAGCAGDHVLRPVGAGTDHHPRISAV